jgi:hypothetical protein
MEQPDDVNELYNFGVRYFEEEHNVSASIKYLVMAINKGSEKAITYLFLHFFVINNKFAIKCVIEFCNDNIEHLIKFADIIGTTKFDYKNCENQSLIFCCVNAGRLFNFEKKIFCICIMSKILTIIYNNIINNKFDITDNKNNNELFKNTLKNSIVLIKNYDNNIFDNDGEEKRLLDHKNSFYKCIYNEQHKKLMKYVVKHINNILLYISIFLFDDRRSIFSKLTYEIIQIDHDTDFGKKYIKVDLMYFEHWYQIKKIKLLKKNYKPGGDGYILAKKEFKSIVELQNKANTNTNANANVNTNTGSDTDVEIK